MTCRTCTTRKQNIAFARQELFDAAKKLIRYGTPALAEEAKKRKAQLAKAYEAFDEHVISEHDVDSAG